MAFIRFGAKKKFARQLPQGHPRGWLRAFKPKSSNILSPAYKKEVSYNPLRFVGMLGLMEDS